MAKRRITFDNNFDNNLLIIISDRKLTNQSGWTKKITFLYCHMQLKYRTCARYFCQLLRAMLGKLLKKKKKLIGFLGFF